MKMVIFGCGYIGSEVGALWKKNGHTVTATTRFPEQIDPLFRAAQKSVILKGDNEEEFFPLIENNDLVFIEEYTDPNTAKIIRYLALEMDMPRRLIYMSSSLIYGDHQGQWVDETSELKAPKDLKTLIDTEHSYLSLNEVGWSACLFRVSEIYGPGRELSKRVKELENHVMPGTGEIYTNMVHQADCIAAIDYAVRHHLEGIYNLADDDHPTQKKLYDAIAQKFRIAKMKWDPSHTPLYAANKRVSNHKIKSEGFAFRHPLRLLD